MEDGDARGQSFLEGFFLKVSERKMVKVLLTGSLGYIGMLLTQHLRESGYEIIGADILMKDYDDYIRADVTSFEDLYRIFSKKDLDLVIHMAGEVGRMRSEGYPAKMIRSIWASFRQWATFILS